MNGHHRQQYQLLSDFETALDEVKGDAREQHQASEGQIQLAAHQPRRQCLILLSLRSNNQTVFGKLDGTSTTLFAKLNTSGINECRAHEQHLTSASRLHFTTHHREVWQSAGKRKVFKKQKCLRFRGHQSRGTWSCVKTTTTTSSKPQQWCTRFAPLLLQDTCAGRCWEKTSLRCPSLSPRCASKKLCYCLERDQHFNQFTHPLSNSFLRDIPTASAVSSTCCRTGTKNTCSTVRRCTRSCGVKHTTTTSCTSALSRSGEGLNVRTVKHACGLV